LRISDLLKKSEVRVRHGAESWRLEERPAGLDVGDKGKIIADCEFERRRMEDRKKSEVRGRKSEIRRRLRAENSEKGRQQRCQLEVGGGRFRISDCGFKSKKFGGRRHRASFDKLPATTRGAGRTGRV